MISTRIFPRYDIENLKGKISLKGITHQNLQIKNISFGGFQIITMDKLITQDFNLFDISILKSDPPIQLYAKQLWYQDQTKLYKSGFKLRFQDRQSLEKWKKIIFALHLHQKRKDPFSLSRELL